MLTTCVYSGAAGFFCPAPATLPAHYMARRALQNLRSAMISYFKPVLLLFLWLQCHTGFASGNEQLEQLSSHRVWLTLLHYEPVLFGSGSRSAIDSENYFLSSNGRRNPLAELRATVTALEIRLSMLTITPSANFLQDTCGCVNTLKACAMLSQ